MVIPRTLAIILGLGGISLTGGCASQPGITFESSRCEAPKEEGRVKALVFTSTFEANNLQGEQLLYQVRLFDLNRHALASRDGQYQTADGTVAATVSMMVLESPQTFKDVRVSIPSQELAVPPNNLPIFAEIAVLKAGGERVAISWCPVPRLRMAELMPPLGAAPPIPYWFVRHNDPNRLPILLGAFASMAEAQAAMVDSSDPPKQVNSDQYLWFVPFHSQHPDQNAILVGPCFSEEDAREIASLYESTPALKSKGLVAGAPIEVQVGQWLKEREVSQIVSSHPAVPEDGAAKEEPPKPRGRRPNRNAPRSTPEQ